MGNKSKAKREDQDSGPQAKRAKHEKPSAVDFMYKGKAGGRDWTLSVALPASIVANAQSHELRSYLVAQIARALTIYGVDEVVLYEDQEELVQQGPGGDDSSWNSGGAWNDNSWGNDKSWGNDTKKDKETNSSTSSTSSTTSKQAEEQAFSWAMNFFALNLQYLETPQYLRKILFPMHSDLKFAGVQNPLDAPHHLRKGENIQFREGVILVEKHHPYTKPKKDGVFVCCGLDEPVWIEDGCGAEEGVRVTVRLNQEDFRYGELVSPSVPREELGIYWGYHTRTCRSLQEVFTQKPFWCEQDEEQPVSNKGAALISKRRQKMNFSFHPFENYDLVLGTSERGRDMGTEFSTKKKLQFKHCLVLFGSLGGLEAVMKDPIFVKREQESQLAGKKEEDNKWSVSKNPRQICHHYLNTCPHQTSRTIRAEEALLITLSSLDRFLEKA
ncbi:unnamed protein product [Amoebophrya sp. A25]|nr:unnamed protein product [Amoebophrya sp. A25]|eukprot:GSA25T00027202001.1